MQKTTSKALCFFLAVLMLFSVFPLSAFGLSGDGESSGGSGGGHAVSGGYSDAGTANTVQGFRFSLMDNTSGSWSTVKSIDIFRNAAPTWKQSNVKVLRGKLGGQFYYNVSKYMYFKNYETIALKEIPMSETGYRYLSDSTTGLLTLPSTTKNMKDKYGTSEEAMTPILQKLGLANGCADLSNYNMVTIEPIYVRDVDNMRIAGTPSDFAVLGAIYVPSRGDNHGAKGFNSTGEIGAGGGEGWRTICRYTNNEDPDSLYTEYAHMGIPAGGVVASGSLLTFKQIVTKGYGLMVCWNEAAEEQSNAVSVRADAWKTDGTHTNADGMNVFISTSNTNYKAEKYSQKLVYDSGSGTYINPYKVWAKSGGTTYYIWASVSDQKKDVYAYTGDSIVVTPSGTFSGVISYPQYKLYANDPITKITTKYTPPNSTASYSFESANGYIYLLSGTKTNNTATVKAETAAERYLFDRFEFKTCHNGSVTTNTNNPWNEKEINYPSILDAYGKKILLQSTAHFLTDGSSWVDSTVPANFSQKTGERYRTYTKSEVLKGPGALNTKNGHRFLGWYVYSVGSDSSWKVGDRYENANGITLANASGKIGDVTFAPIWSDLTTYTVTYNANGGTGAPDPQVKKHDENLKLSSVKPTWTGHTFLSWNTKADGTGTTYAPGAVYSKNANMTLYAQWKVHTYTVHYIGNTNTGGSTPDTHHTYGVSSKLANNGFTKTGYKFGQRKMAGEWYTTNYDQYGTKSNSAVSLWAAGNAYDEGATVLNLTDKDNATINLYAGWSPILYYIKYNGNGADSGSIKNQGIFYDDTDYIKTNVFKRTGYVFSGWNTKANGTGTKYSENQAVKNLFSTEGSVLELYAQWKPITYKVQYYLDGALQSSLTQTCTYDVSYNYKALPTKTGNTVTGWNTDPDMDEDTVKAGASFKNLSTVQNDVIKLYAKSKEHELYVAYNVNGGTVSDNSLFKLNTLGDLFWKSADGRYFMTAKYNDPFNVLDPSADLAGIDRPGYTFNGWFVEGRYILKTQSDYQLLLSSNNLSDKITKTNTQTPLYTSTKSVRPNNLADLVSNEAVAVFLKAKWMPNKYSIEYHWRENGVDKGKIDTQPSPVTYTAGTGATLGKIPSLTGYTVTNQGTNNWFTSLTGSTTASSVPATANGKQVYYAERTAIDYSITYKWVFPDGSVGGTYSTLTPTSYTVATTTFNLPAPKLPSGYKALVDGKWHTDAKCTSDAVSKIAKGTTGNKVYYTMVTREYTISYHWRENGVDKGTISGLLPTTYVTGTTASLPNIPVLEGYTVKNQGKNTWYTGPSGTATANGIKAADKGNKVFYAERTANSYKIRYVLNGGSFPDGQNAIYTNAESGTKYHRNPTTVKYMGTPEEGFSKYFNVQKPTRTGYTFIGWTITNMDSSTHHVYYNSKDNTSTATSWANTSNEGNAATFYNLRADNGQTVTFTANWKANQYTITYKWVLPDGKTVGGTYSSITPTGYTFGTGATLGGVQNPDSSKYTMVDSKWHTDLACNSNAVTKIDAAETGNKVYYTKVAYKTYTIEYHWRENGIDKGKISGVAPATYAYGSGATLGIVPSVTGYTVKNQGTNTWYNGLTGTATATSVPAASTGNKVFYAERTANSYKIQYVLNGGTFADGLNATGFNSSNNQSYHINPTSAKYMGTPESGYSYYFRINYPVRTGYTFNGWTIENLDNCTHTIWYDNANHTSSATSWTNTSKEGKAKAFYNLRADNGQTVVFTANWTPNKLKVYYNANGGSVKDGTVNGTMYYNKLTSDNSIIHSTNSAATTKTCHTFTYNTPGDFVNATSFYLTKTGYTFAGWNTKADGTGTLYDETTKYTPTDLSPNLTTGDRELTLYAKWTPNTYKVQYYLDGDLLSSLTQTCTYDKSYNYKPLPTKNDHTVVGWLENSNGTGNNYAAGSSFKNLSSVHNAVVKRYATSDMDMYTVTVNVKKNDAAWKDSGLPVKLVLKNDTSVQYTLSTVSGTSSYSSSAIPSGIYVVYTKTATGGNQISTESYVGTLTVAGANVSKTINYYSVTLRNGSGISGTTGSINWIIEGGQRSINATILASHNWAKWTNTSDGSDFITTQNYTIKNIHQAYDLTANGTIKTFTVTYNANGGTGAPGKQPKTYGVDLTLSSQVPTRTGYKFLNWNTKSDGSGTTYAPGSKYTGNANVTLYAQWTPITYLISYDLKGGTFSNGYDTVGVDSTNGNKFYRNPTSAKYMGTPEEGFVKYFAVNNPVREGFTFAGWNVTNMDGTTHYYWFNSKNNTSTAASWSYTSDQSKALDNTSRYFYNLRATEGATESENTVKFTAHWTPITYNIEYDLKGGTFTDGLNATGYNSSNNLYHHINPTSAQYMGTPESGYSYYFRVNYPVRTGYTFNGWTVENLDSCTHVIWYDNANQTSTATSWNNTSNEGRAKAFRNLRATSGTVKFTANWTPIKYTVHYNPNGATSGSTADSSHVYDTEKALTKNGFKRQYTVTYKDVNGNTITTYAASATNATATWLGWAKTASGSIVAAYAENPIGTPAKVLNLTSTNGATIQIYAKWQLGTVTLPELPDVPGYTPSGWIPEGSDPDTTTPSTPGTTDTPSTDTTYVPVYTPNTLKIGYNANGGSLSNTSYKLGTESQILLSSGSRYYQTQKYNDAFDVAASTKFGMTKTGYTFNGWYVSTTSETPLYWSGMSPKPVPTDLAPNLANKDTTVILKAKWSKNTYYVEYYINGSLYKKQTCLYDNSYSYLTMPTSDGVVYFNETWNSKSDLTGTSYAPGTSFKNLTATKNGTIKLYAKTNEKTYTISYNANGGINAPENQVKRHNVPLTLSEQTPTRTGYTFLDWNTSSDGTGTTYTPGSTFSTNADTVLYAQWRKNTLKVYYNANNGAVKDITLSGTLYYNKLTSDKFIIHSTNIATTTRYYQTLTYNTAADFVNATTFGLTRTGYVFAGWNTKADGTGTLYDETTKYTPTDLVPALATGDQELALYAKWTPITYSVHYDPNGATSGTMSNSSHTYDVAKNLTANAYARKYTVTYKDGSGNVITTYAASATTATATFNGWAKTATGTKAYNDKQSVKNLSSTNNAIVNIYAVWTLGSVTLPTPPDKPGYVPSGWVPEDNPSDTPKTPGTTVTPEGPTTYIPVYSPIIYYVKYNGNGATSGSMSNSTHKYDVAKNLTANAYARKYTVTYKDESGNVITTYAASATTATATFNGWAKTATGAKAYNDKQSVKNLTTTNGATVNIYAVWTLGSVTLPTPPDKPGYVPTGWVPEDNPSDTPKTPGTTVTPDGPTTYIPEYTPITYYVKYNGNGATSGSMSNSTHVYNVAKNLTKNAYKRVYSVTYKDINGNVIDSYATSATTATATFNGWAKTSTGAKTYNDQQSVKNLTATNGAIVNIYANWTLGSVSLPTPPDRPGYVPTGWVPEDSPEGTTPQTPGTTVTPNGPTTYIPVYSPITYYVKYNGNGATSGSMSNSTHVYDVAKNLTKNAYKRVYTVTYKDINGNVIDSYATSATTATATFNGWAKTAKGAKAYNNQQSVVNLTKTNGATVNIFANWTLGSVTLPTPPDVPGHIPTGWVPEDSPEGTTPQKPGTTVTPNGPTTFIPVYTPVERLALEAVTQNAVYITGTDVVTSFRLINDYARQRIPSDDVTVTFKVYNGESVIKTVTMDNVVVPGNETNLLYFKWTVPADLGSSGVSITGEITEYNQVNPSERETYGFIQNNYQTSDIVVSRTPEIEYNPMAKADFAIPEAPANTAGEAEWDVWVYENNAFKKNHYAIQLTSSAVVAPDENANTWTSNGKTMTRSGYGLEFTVTGSITNKSGAVAAPENSYTNIQYGNAYVPEYSYSSEFNEYRSFELVDGSLVLPENADFPGERSQFVPLWFPDADYVVTTEASGCWTPVGMITSVSAANPIGIVGTVYDDWNIQ